MSGEGPVLWEGMMCCEPLGELLEKHTPIERLRSLGPYRLVQIGSWSEYIAQLDAGKNGTMTVYVTIRLVDLPKEDKRP